MTLSISLLSFITNTSNLELFARSGGGGSSSGGSGGGGGSVLVLIGYLPMHVLGSFLRKKLNLLIASVIGWIFAVSYAIILASLFGGIGFVIGIGALIGIGAGLYNWFDKIAKLAGVAKKKQEIALQKDSSWNTAALNTQVSEIFRNYQADWSNNDSASMRSYLSPYYFYHNQLMIYALKQLGRQNLVNQPTIKSMDIVDITDEDDNIKDRFVMLVRATATDDLYDVNTKSLIFRDQNPFSEYWKFVRADGSRWLLEGISQTTEDPYMRNNVIAKFATSHDYFYSADWGWLLLPTRGQLFSEGKFGTSDINNHVIGVYHNTVIQLYNYIPFILRQRASVKNYLIAQVALPKTYGNIVVRKKRLISIFGVKGLTRVSMEWGEFNKRFEVWASDMERVTSFELLNPSFMVKLQEAPFEINIEVVDNVVYLYSIKVEAAAENYEVLLTILYQSFKEMRM